jgi:mucin-19
MGVFFRENPDSGRSGVMTLSHRNGFGPTGVIFCAFFTFAAMACAGTYSGGSGTAEDPYKIATKADWQELIATSADWGKQFVLLNDLDFQGMALTPVGVASPPFTGVFEGNRHVLRNVIISLPTNDNVGIFGYVDSGGQILNLGAENVTITGHACVGGLAGRNDYGVLNSCYAIGTINGFSFVGGLVGENNTGTIETCYATGAVSGSDRNVGGLVGENAAGTICACYATGTVNSSSSVGGLVGVNEGTITTCYATGTVNGSDSIGGLVGYNIGTINANFWDMQTSGQTDSSVGKGLTTYQMKTLSVFQNAGWAGKGWVMQDGLDYPRLIWENTEGMPIPPAVLPFSGSGTAADPYRISTAQEFAALSWYSGMLDQQICLTQDLDLSEVALSPIGDLGRFTGVFDGKGHTLSHGVIHCDGSDYVGLFSIIGYGGQIRNLGVEHATVTGRCWVGGMVGENEGTITACYITSAVSGSRDVGGMVGSNSGTITDSYAIVALSGTSISSTVGGLVGVNYGAISACYATGTVSSSGGGLVGVNFGTVLACYSTGTVSGSGNYVGGLMGVNYGTISACYATGTVSSSGGGLVGKNFGMIKTCFWDKQTSGRTVSSGGTGKTTVQMKAKATFTDAGWDFVGEGANGAEDVWRMCGDGISYPRLSWEFSQGGDMNCPNGVGLEDLVYLAGRWMAGTPETVGAADGNGDGRVDLGDFEILAANWMRE